MICILLLCSVVIAAAVSEILAKYVSEKKPAAAERRVCFVISLTGIYLHDNIAYITSIRRSPRTYNNTITVIIYIYIYIGSIFQYDTGATRQTDRRTTVLLQTHNI